MWSYKKSTRVINIDKNKKKKQKKIVELLLFMYKIFFKKILSHSKKD